MRLTAKELTLFRNHLLAKRAYANADIPLGYKVWEPWMKGTLQKLEDELYPQEGDPI
ncbi:hypothetical protein P60_gp20 [Synechococcus phage P60]|uniref:Uncharacterized protein n=1 Tax=Synechococcus phage P60 TaxID=2905923 RepID=L0CQE5_9CAUD|nr:hypothetical protein P60_gp20 [Synechococcus phage P60]AGA17882.1 hypothetical protein P60_gp20 [Synechococcus phage P60]